MKPSLKLFMFSFSVFVVLTGLSASNRIRYRKAYGTKYVYLGDVARYYGMNYSAGRDYCTLSSNYSKLIFRYDKKKGKINGITVHFIFAPYRQGRNVFVSEKDFLKFIDPILRKRALNRHRMKVILLDPGHGGKDNGGRGSYSLEKDIVLNIASVLASKLKKIGYKVLMTRSGDYFLSLEQRAAKTSSLNADIFISIHANVAASSSVSGIETFCLAPYGTSSTYSNDIFRKKEKGHNYDGNNSRLGYDIHKGLLKHCGQKDRGLKRSRFHVLKNASCPAVLLELGFLTNSREEKLLNSRWYQNKIANGIAEGIIRYHRRLKSAGK